MKILFALTVVIMLTSLGLGKVISAGEPHMVDYICQQECLLKGSTWAYCEKLCGY